MSDIRCNEQGLFVLTLRSCTAGILADLLDAEAPYVWIRSHNPHPVIEWWKATIPLDSVTQVNSIEVRELSFDMLIPTARFRKLLPHFEPFGISLVQMSQRVPDTLRKFDTRALLQNGLVSKFHLPHPRELATFASVKRQLIERATLSPRIRELIV